jgi:hypothetical protein
MERERCGQLEHARTLAIGRIGGERIRSMLRKIQ